MSEKDLILKAISYVNDFPTRVDEFLTKEKSNKVKELPKTVTELACLLADFKASNKSIHEFAKDFWTE